MPNATIADTRDTIARATTVMASAKALIDGFKARLQAAKDEALANGATEEELAPLQAEIDTFDEHADDLAAAVQENTPADGPVT